MPFNQPPVDQVRTDDKTRFNMDIAFQESLHRLLSYSSQLGMNRNIQARFNVLREIRIMIASILVEDMIKKHDKIKNAIGIKIDNMDIEMQKHNIWYAGFGYLSEKKHRQSHIKKKISKEFYDLVANICKDLDDWEETIRIEMAKKGFFLLKSKSGLDAASN